MADRQPTADDIRAFMDDDERAYWDSASDEQRAKLKEELTNLWNSIPGPTDEDFTPQYMGSDT